MISLDNKNNNKSLVITKYGGPEVFSIVDTAIPKPKDNQVLVKIDYVALNRADLLFSQGFYKPIEKFPNPCGMEGTGTVVEFASEEVKEKSNLKVGDKVSILCNFDNTNYGTFAQYAVFPYSALVKNNSELVDQKTASAFWVSFLTSYFALVENARIKKGDVIVITAASSGVGLSAISLAKHFGATVIATSRTDKKKDQILSFGADHFIALDSEDYVSRIKEITNGKGANITYDAVAGGSFSKLVESSASFGKIILYGLMDFSSPTVIPVTSIVPKCITIKGFTLYEYLPQTELLNQAIDFLNQNLHQFKSLVGKEFIGIESLGDSLKFLNSSDLFGKVVVKIN
ncbi:hypothetical protein DICPUDRAFT_35975 [Dictyostelium purpureum]|uniref:Enoyl reductase (ER) domain-containing protein n=1 Tax=Dictyostelium purpureum TaxID=5786 RepID=F0ZQ54_DICPU|nr:uncharacterized protein DICPUDRAFT_35975 [Dictyostelium purpureum]EGC33909.1 hypothetical protein DICPUDRAFT_35975 [Dictyostelium purpureum]|eukprot:XP_003289544.1 hypothetical protein DICPUDRAFT_35975 [Dictyostelium purpureum]